MQLNKKWEILGIGLVLLAAACGKPAPKVAFGSGLTRVAASSEILEQEREMHARLNRDRKAQNLPALAYDSRLADIARHHAADMRDHHFFEHDSPNSGTLEDRLNVAGYLFLTARENLSEAPDVQRSQDGLLKSPPHHANIMASDITHVGVGIVAGGVHDARNLTVVQVFSTPAQPESMKQAKTRIQARIQEERQLRGLKPAKVHALLARLAEAHIAELGEDEALSGLGAVGETVSRELAAQRDSGLRGVVASGQLMTDSSGFALPGPLLEGAASFGVATREAKGRAGRPMLQVLVLIGM